MGITHLTAMVAVVMVVGCGGGKFEGSGLEADHMKMIMEIIMAKTVMVMVMVTKWALRWTPNRIIL